MLDWLACHSSICMASTVLEMKSMHYIALFETIIQSVLSVIDVGDGSNKLLFTFTTLMTETNDPARKFSTL